MEEQETTTVSLATASNVYMTTSYNPWVTPRKVDKMDEVINDRNFSKIVGSCRFFYRHDAIVSSVFNKMIDIGINTLNYPKTDLNTNEEKLVDGMINPLQEFAENMALEYLISGLVIPEVKYGDVEKDTLQEFGIKRYTTLNVPVSMWVRDPATIIIESPIIDDSPSYYAKIPDEVVTFIQNKGMYASGVKDIELYKKLLKYYPEFVKAVENGELTIKIENTENIIRRKVVTDSPYPTPYLTAVLEPLKHKRNLRRMDYTIASRVITAIQVFRLGNDEYPLTDDQEDKLNDLKDQIYYRNSQNNDIERVFQLFANHTLEIEWVFPPVEALLNEEKYANVNDDIMLGLGFPRSLIVGESERSNAGNIKISSISPEKTMIHMREKILKILNNVLAETFRLNSLRGKTKLAFDPINLTEFAEWTAALRELYDTGNVSRTSYAKELGYNWEDELDLREEEQKEMKERGIEEFAPKPYSPIPGQNQQEKPPQDNKNQQEK